MVKTDVIIIGAGAAGLMCAIEAGKRGRKVIVIDHANKPGKKILMSGGGRCNFTNLHIHPDKYLSHNPHFCKSALSRYTQWDFIELVKQYKIFYHEKTLGQLFCDEKSKDILNMLLRECEKVGVKIYLDTKIENIENNYMLKTSRGDFFCESLVVASGGLSIPTLGASPFGYKIAEQFGLKVWPTRAGLVPLTLHVEDKEKYSILSGVAVESIVKNKKISFQENILFTHRGLSGPAILQISSYWNPGEVININMLNMPKRVAELFSNNNMWDVLPNGTEGYRTAEVTLGGIDCDNISSKTFEVNNHPGLYFIGEVLDVTGWLGGYNFQWAWSSGWACGQVV